jgi:hypothetical protein
MWCCFNANTVLEPTKLKPLTAEVPVAKKPVTLMFRLPSEEENVEKKVELVEAVSTPEDVLEPQLENAQGEEVPSLSREECNNPFTILLALVVLGFLYSTMSQSDISEL